MMVFPYFSDLFFKPSCLVCVQQRAGDSRPEDPESQNKIGYVQEVPLNANLCYLPQMQ